MGAVLIVDDSTADRILLRTILSRAGYKVYEVSKGCEVRQKGAGGSAARDHSRREPARFEWSSRSAVPFERIARSRVFRS